MSLVATMTYNFKFSALVQYASDIAAGALLTLNFSVVTIVLGLTIGGVVALGRNNQFTVIRASARIYGEALRKAPEHRSRKAGGELSDEVADATCI